MPQLLTGCEDDICLPQFLAARNCCLATGHFYERCKSWLLVLQWEEKLPTPGALPAPRAVLLQVPEIKSYCQLLCCGSPLAMSIVWEPACPAAVRGSGDLGICLAWEALGVPQGHIADEILTWLSTLSARGAILCKAHSVISGGKQTTPAVNSVLPPI